jgi:hypothetical protein
MGWVHDEKCELTTKGFRDCGCAQRAYRRDPFPIEDMPVTIEPLLMPEYPVGISWGEARARAVAYLAELGERAPDYTEDPELIMRGDW